MNLVAKPIVKGEYWVVTDGDKKVGNVVSEGDGYSLKIGGRTEHFDSTKTIETSTNISFEKIQKKTNKELPFSVYPTESNRTYNNVLDVKRKLHLFTKTAKSKCYHVAGYFALKQNNEYDIVFCPKYIFIQRYKYIGPFKTEIEAKNSINTK